MSPPNPPNPERRSNNAMLCFCLGVGLCALAYFLGIVAILGAALSGNDPAIIVGSVLGVVGVVLLGAAGALMAIIGGVWMIVRVIADQNNNAEEARYRNVER